MKRYAWLGLWYLVAASGFAQQHLPDYIDEAVFKAARYLEQRLPLDARVILVNDPSKEVEEAVFHTLESNLVNADKLEVVERNEKILHLINEELNFQYSGEVSDDSLVALGHKSGAKYIVLISVNPQGNSIYRFRIKAVNVETARIVASQEYRFQRQVAIQSRIIVDYRLTQLTYDQDSEAIGEGDVYLGLGFSVHSEINIENIPRDNIEQAASSDLNRKNICFVIDISGSMGGPIDQGTEKINWVKREIKQFFEKNIGENDVISVVVFDDKSDEIIQSKRIKDKGDVASCISTIEEKLSPRGGTMIAQGLRKGYDLVNKINEKDEYINCVILFTDGESNQEYDKTEVKKIVAEHRAKGIATLSTVALSTSARSFMTEVAGIGGGLSLFVDSNNASKPRNKELDLMVTAAAATLKNREHRLDIKLSAPEGVTFTDASAEHTGLTPEFAHYRMDVTENEHKIIWLKASLDSKAVQNGGITDVAITAPPSFRSPANCSLLPRRISLPTIKRRSSEIIINGKVGELCTACF
jgi:Mg-chelatase subunit ChlD